MIDSPQVYLKTRRAASIPDNPDHSPESRDPESSCGAVLKPAPYTRSVFTGMALKGRMTT
jgi:hypothetical protein